VRAKALATRYLAEFLDDRQVAVVPSRWTGPILPLASLQWRRRRIGLALEVIGPIRGGRSFALSPVELILELAVLAPQLLDLGFELLGSMHGPSVHRLPVSRLLPQRGVLAAQSLDFLAQLDHFAMELPHQFRQISRRVGRSGRDKRAVHNRHACNSNRPSRKGATVATKRVGQSFTNNLY